MRETWINRSGGKAVNFLDEQIALFPEISDFELCQKIAKYRDGKDNKNGFMLYNLDRVVNRIQLWHEHFPGILPFYAVKVNDNILLLEVMNRLGCSFDCASQGEVEKVLSLGVEPDRIIFAHPAKTVTAIKYAKSMGVELLVVDSLEELMKHHKHFPNCKTVLRIAASSGDAKLDLSQKFGADSLDEAPEILRLAAELGIPVHGISFHVGFGCDDHRAIPKALENARSLTILGRSLGLEMKMVDIGGGYSGTSEESFKKCAASAMPCLEKLTKELAVRCVAEPGSFFACPAATICANVQLAKEVSLKKITGNDDDDSKRGMEYYITSTIFGAFVCVLWDYLDAPGRPLFPKNAPEMISRIWGPTCDSKDKIETNKSMERLTTGDWIFYDFKGAYTQVCESPFNGFPHPDRLYCVTEHVWQLMQEKSPTEVNNNYEKL